MQKARKLCLSDYPGKKFIIYFYPKDNTPAAPPRRVASTTVSMNLPHADIR